MSRTARFSTQVHGHRAPVGPTGLLALIIASLAPLGSAQSRTYTLDADFDEGILQNVNHDAPNNDQLKLNTTTSPFPFVNIAASSRGTMVRIDVNTGVILGEFFTAPSGMGRNPSRTTVDLFGNVWVSNRDEFGFSGGQPKGSVTRIGVVIGGTRTDAVGNPDPTGQYLAPPFTYNTCIDRDGDGLIRTSMGLGNILPWTNAGGLDSDGGVSTAEDECIINYTRVTGTGTRTVAIDGNNDVWVGGFGDLDHEKLDGLTGLPVPGTQFNLGCGGYGGLVDCNGILWSARGGTGLLRYDTSSAIGVCLDFTRGDYGLGIDPATGHIWHTTLSGNSVKELAPDGSVLNSYFHGNGNAQGVAVDSSGNVWVAHSLFGATTVGHLRTNGTFVGNVPLPGGNGPTGVAVDSNGKVWVANINTNNAMRIDPSAGPVGGGGFPVGAVDLIVDLGAGAGPYNYSDMTGFVSIGSTSPQGTWTVVFDSGMTGTDDCTVSWNSSEPAGTSVGVEVRAADNLIDLPTELFVSVTNGVEILGLSGRYYEIRATLAREGGIGGLCSVQDLTPCLFDLTIECAVQECFVLDFDEDDEGQPLVHGQHLDNGDPEFDGGALFPVTITSSVLNSGLATAAILDSTHGPAAQDPDLLVGSGNILILQNDANLSECPPNSGIYCSHNDDENGGTLTFSFADPSTPTSVVLIDSDTTDSAWTVVLTDAMGAQRTYTVPPDWTGDGGTGALDLTTTDPQPGFASIATSVEDLGYEPTAVHRIDFNVVGSGAVDDLSWCRPGAPRVPASVSTRNGTGVNRVVLEPESQPVIGGTWAAQLDCSGLGNGIAVLSVRLQADAGTMTPLGEQLISGALLHGASRAFVSSGSRLVWNIPSDPALIGLQVHAQGLCWSSPGVFGSKVSRVRGRLSNALDLTLGF